MVQVKAPNYISFIDCYQRMLQATKRLLCWTYWSSFQRSGTTRCLFLFNTCWMWATGKSSLEMV